MLRFSNLLVRGIGVESQTGKYGPLSLDCKQMAREKSVTIRMHQFRLISTYRIDYGPIG